MSANDPQLLAKHVRKISRYEGITEGQASVLRAAADALEALSAHPTEETEWEYGCRSTAHFPRPMVLHPDDAPSEHGEECPSPSLVRRRAAGPWGLVPADGG